VICSIGIVADCIAQYADNGMDPWLIWIIVAVALLVAEATTTAFVAVYFGVAAAVAAALAAAGLPVAIQVVAFAGVSFGGLALTRPALKRLAMTGPNLRTGVEGMRGRKGMVTRAIAELEPGQVKIEGETWSARSYFDGEPIGVGTRVEVVEVKGVTALVIPAPSPNELTEQGASNGD
jgi:membrane protein implicated in regulation of membrane protease activity